MLWKIKNKCLYLQSLFMLARVMGNLAYMES